MAAQKRLDELVGKDKEARTDLIVARKTAGKYLLRVKTMILRTIL